jgi:hypothetical protein
MHEPPEATAALAKYTAEIAAQTREARNYVRQFFPRGYELVYDNYNAFGFGIATGTKATDVRVSLVAYPKWVSLFFLYGASLDDPHHVLQGSGSRVRSVRLVPPSLLHSADVIALLEQEVQRCSATFAAAPMLTTVVKAVAAKRRPRAPTKKATAAKGKPHGAATREA